MDDADVFVWQAKEATRLPVLSRRKGWPFGRAESVKEQQNVVAVGTADVVELDPAMHPHLVHIGMVIDIVVAR